MFLHELKKKKRENNFKDILNHKNTPNDRDEIFSSKVLVNNNTKHINEAWQNENLIDYLKENKDIILFENRRYNGINHMSDIIPRYIYEIYLNHFFNFIKKKNIKIVKGRVLNYRGKKDIVRVGINGLIVPISKYKLTYHAKKLYNYKRRNKGYSFYKLIELAFFCENIKKNNNNINLELSRKKFLKILKKKKNATI